MDRKELIHRVRTIELKAKGLSNNLFAGMYHTAFKGRGMTFSEVREYRIGDEIRSIDWNVTARYQEPHIKLFEEERELTLMLLVDISHSMGIGAARNKRERLVELMATLAFSALENKDKVGVLFYSSKVEAYFPPSTNKKQVLQVLYAALERPLNQGTSSLTRAMKFLMNVQKKRAIVVAISDFNDDENINEAFRWTAKRHACSAIRLYDKQEMELPKQGLMEVVHSETGKRLWLDTRQEGVKERLFGSTTAHKQKMEVIFKKLGVPLIEIDSTSDYIPVLTQLFAQRR